MSHFTFSDDAASLFFDSIKAEGFSSSVFVVAQDVDTLRVNLKTDHNCYFALEYMRQPGIFMFSSMPSVHFDEKTPFTSDMAACVPAFRRWLELIKHLLNVRLRFTPKYYGFDSVEPYLLHPTEPLSAAQHKLLRQVALEAWRDLQNINPLELSNGLIEELRSLYNSVKNAPQGYAHFALVGFLLTRGSQHPALVEHFTELAEVITSRILLS
jgi:hypothetical protein